MTARIVFRISVLVLLLYSAVTQKCPGGGPSERSILGWMLQGHVYDTLLAERPFTCVLKFELGYLSSNVRVKQQDKGSQA